MSHTCREWFRLITSAIGVVLGLAAFIVFFCCYGNHSAGVWGLFSGVFAAICFHMHYLHFRDRLDSWHSIETLQGVKLLGVMAGLAGSAGCAWYIFSAIYHDIPVMPVVDSAYIAAVWAFMTAKWGFLLYMFGRFYISVILHDNPRLIRI